jgi:hypothetical protein
LAQGNEKRLGSSRTRTCFGDEGIPITWSRTSDELVTIMVEYAKIVAEKIDTPLVIDQGEIPAIKGVIVD